MVDEIANSMRTPPTLPSAEAQASIVQVLEALRVTCPLSILLKTSSSAWRSLSALSAMWMLPWAPGFPTAIEDAGADAPLDHLNLAYRSGSEFGADFLQQIVLQTVTRPPAVEVHVAAIMASMLEIPKGSGAFALSVGLFAHYADAEFYRRQARGSSPSYKAPVVDESNFWTWRCKFAWLPTGDLVEVNATAHSRPLMYVGVEHKAPVHPAEWTERAGEAQGDRSRCTEARLRGVAPEQRGHTALLLHQSVLPH